MKRTFKTLITMLLVISLLMSNFAMIFSFAALAPYPVELAFNNIFVFEKWANHPISSIALADGVPIDKSENALVADIENGSFRLTKKNMDANEVYTAFSMDTENAAFNSSYYNMSVEPNTSYTFSYHITGTVWEFTPFVFFYTSEGLFKGIEYLVAYGTPGYGYNRFEFTTPSDVTAIQIRFTIGDDSGSRAEDKPSSVYADVKDIVICKSEYLSANNLFDFEGWANNTKSGSIQQSIGGTISKDVETGSFTLTTDNQMDEIYTAHSMDANPAGNVNFYTIDVAPNTLYAFSYNLVDCNFPNFRPFVFIFDDSNAYISLSFEDAKGYGKNSFSFTTPANASHIQVRFGVNNNKTSVSGTVKDIAIYEVNFEQNPGHPHRKSYTYGNGDTYGTLPAPSIVPEGYVFGGWFTGEDGDGTRITENTPVHHSSLVVYPKYEPAVDTLEVATMPAKTAYTVGEKFNPTGLVLEASQSVWVDEWTDLNENEVVDSGETERVEHVNSYNISSGYYCTPEYLTTAGTQTITAHYGGKTATFTVNVSDSNSYNLPVNGVAQSVTIKNNEYTLNYSTSAFNRYEMTYFSDSYVKGTITFTDGYSEDFFLEPSDNGSFASYIDGYLNKDLSNNITTTTRSGIKSIKFTCLDKEYGNFELLSVKTINASVNTSDSMRYYQNKKYKVGIDLAFGGVVSYIEDLENKPVAGVYTENGKDITRVDFSNKLPSGAKATDNSVNLINYNDKGRYLQQSYYGTNQPPFEMGDYNGVPWNYNPVQGGNIGNEASKIIDFEITDTQIYIKTRPLDWGKDSSRYPDSYNTPSYMEAWYVFEDGMIKVYCRFVDYSGYPSNTTTQEFPALYTIEPLNNFVYHDGSKLVDIEEPDFWGVLPEYNALLKANGKSEVDVNVDCAQYWAAFTASPDDDSFGIGVYSPGISNIHYGVFPAIYNEETVKNDKKLVENYRHAASLDPAQESPTSYISPVGTMTFESYKPTEYSFYITTGTAKEIQDDFVAVSNKDVEAENAKTKIAIPETVYLNPADNKAGQYYVNNNLTDSLSIETVAKRDDTKMQFGVHYDLNKADSFSIKVSNVTDSTNTVTLSGYTAGEKLELDRSGNYINTDYSLSLAKAITHNDIAVVKWELTFYKDGAEVETNTAYTVLYAPMRTVGAVSESRRNSDSNNELSSWITGANGVDHQAFSPLGSWKGDIHDSGYFLQDPLYNGPKASGGVSENSHDYIHTDYPNYAKNPDLRDDKGEDAYVVQAATDGHDSSRSQSYLGLLMVDKSRYTNTNQIPNLRIGFDALRVASNKNNSLEDYYTMYTLGTSDSFTSTKLHERPSGWTETHHENLADNKDLPFRTEVIPSYSVSSIDGKYIHAMAHGRCQALQIYEYASAGTSVLCTVTDKGTLRDSVLTGYTITKGDYPEDRYNNFIDALENAATVLGDPAADQATIDLAKKELNEAIEKLNGKYFALKYDNLFSLYEFSQHADNMKVVSDRGTATYENGTLEIVNGTITGGEAYTIYGSADNFYKVELKPNTEYVFEYDVTSDVKSQAFMFFYDSDDSNSENPTNISVKSNGGAWVSKSESNSWWGNYANAGTYHFVIKFTTGATTTQAGFRFGNTSNDPTTSTFSNIRLIDSAHYYEDVEYSKTEDVFFEDEAYGELMTLTRPGYAFDGWKDINGTVVTATSTAIEHKSIYSQWTEHSYTIKYDPNSGEGSIGNQSAKYTTNVTLASSGFTRAGYILAGWATSPDASDPTYQLGQTVSKLTGEKDGIVTLYAVWHEKFVNVTFDNLIDISEWSESVGNGTLENKTATGFTVKSNNGAGEATSSSAYFPVKAGEKYIIEADIVGNNWDIYIFFNSATSTGTGIGFDDSKNRLASGHNVAEVNGTKYISTEFTAPEGAVRAELRMDANGSNNAVRFENIRVYDASEKTSVDPVNKYVQYKLAYGDLPVPVKEGYLFTGWEDGNGNKVTKDTIMNSLTTVFLKSTWKIKPNEVYNDAVVIEYGLPVRIDVLSNDSTPRGGEITGIAGAVNGGTTLNKTPYESTQLVGGASTIQMAYGKVAIEGNQIVFTPSVTDMSEEAEFYYECKADGSYYYAQVTVIPATSIYYEESFMTFEDGKDGYVWVDVGTTLENKFQTADIPGAMDKAYGYDEAYNDSYTYSLGSAKMTTVDNKALGKEPIAKFTFSGTGFALYGVTNNDTGMVMVTIYNAGTTTIYKNFLVDTYYGYADEAGTIYQVPVINRSDLAYGTYDVVIKPLYSFAFDPNSENGEGDYSIYIDSVRIFNPAGDVKEGSTIGDAYIADGEYAPQYKDLRDIILSAEDFTNKVTALGYSGAIFLDGNSAADIATYKTQGPKNEVYLGPNQAVAFMVSVENVDALASLQLGMKVVSGGEKAKVTVLNSNNSSVITTYNLSGAHEMFRSLDSAVEWNGNKSWPIVIANVSNTVISLTSLKWAHTSAPVAVDFMVQEDTPAMAMFAMRRAVAAVDPFNEENVSISWSDTSFVEGKEATLTVVTLPEIVAVTVDGIDVTECEIDENGNKVWTYTFTVVQTGENAYDIMLFDANGESGEPIKTETIYVEEAPEETTTEAPETEAPSEEPETEEPSEETTEAPTVAPEEELPEGDDSQDDSGKPTSIFSIILRYLKSLINFFRRLFA